VLPAPLVLLVALVHSGLPVVQVVVLSGLVAPVLRLLSLAQSGLAAPVLLLVLPVVRSGLAALVWHVLPVMRSGLSALVLQLLVIALAAHVVH
jgi:hypothetical protein